MNVGLRPYLSTALAAIAAVVFVHAGAARADDAGLYGGRTLPSGVSASPPKDPTQLALEPGSAALGGDAARLDGERIFGGYRFGPGFALEGTRTRTGASGLGSNISVAGIGSLPLTDSVTLMSKLGLSYQPSAFAGGASLADVTNGAPLYGVGLSVRLRDNVEVRAQTEHFGRSAGPAQGAPAGDSVLFGAGVRF